MSDIHNLLRHEDELADGLACGPLLGIEEYDRKIKRPPD